MSTKKSIHDADVRTMLGSELSPTDKRIVLSAFCHRFTGQHKPAHMGGIWRDGLPYPLQFKDDADWLSHTEFAVNKRGSLRSDIGECYSHPTWPNNPELRKPALASI